MKGGARRRASQIVVYLMVAMVVTQGALGAAGDISTFAGAITYLGSDVRDYDTLNAPRMVIADHTNSNHRIIVETGGHRIRKLTDNSVVTIVGVTGLKGFAGDGGPAKLARLSEPTDAAFDAVGNLYIADSRNHRIRKVDAVTGLITTFAGNGTGGFNGDGLGALQTSFSYPSDIELDSSGNIYVADRANNRIRKIDGGTGIVSTVAGNGSYLHCGDPPYPNGQTWNPIGDGGLAVNACIAAPKAVRLYGGDLYVADTENHRIRKVSLAFQTIDTVAGSGCKRQYDHWFPLDPQPLQGPIFGVSKTVSDLYERPCSFQAAPATFTGDPQQCHMWTAPGQTNCVSGQTHPTQYYDPGGSGDGVVATSANLAFPHDFGFDSSGNLYIADTGWGGNSSTNGWGCPSSATVVCAGNRIRKVDAASQIISTVAGTNVQGFTGDGGTATSARINKPQGLLIVGNTFEFADIGNGGNQGSGRVRRVDAGGTISTIVGTRALLGCCIDDGLPASFAFIQNVRGTAVAPSGDTYLSDSDHHRVIRVHPSGEVTTVAGNGTSPPFVTSSVSDGGLATDGLLNYPRGITVDSSGNLYIADTLNNRVRKVSTGGTISTVAGACSPSAFGCAEEGSVPGDGDGGPATSAWLKWPTDVTVDSAGNLYIAEPYMQRIRKVDTTGVISTFAGSGYICPRFSYNGTDYDPPVSLQSCGRMYPLGNGAYTGDKLPIQDVPYDYGKATEAKLNFPMGVAVDSSGNVFIADTANHKIRKVDTDGWITTVAGSGAPGFAFLPNQVTELEPPVSAPGDGGPAALGALGYPHDVVVDSSGTLFIADTYGARVRKVDTSGIITTVAGNGCHHGYSGIPNFGEACPLGDGGDAIGASLRWPVAVAIKGSGLLIAEAEAENFTSDQITSAQAATLPGNVFSACLQATAQNWNCTTDSALIRLGYKSADRRGNTNNRVRLVAGS